MTSPIAMVGWMITAAVVVAEPACATTVTFVMDEVSLTQPIDGLTASKGGISVTYRAPLGNGDPFNILSYDSGGPGFLTYVQDPSIQGNNQQFSASFSRPVTGIQFGLAESTSTPLSGVQVQLSDGSVHSFDLSLTDPFAEGQFTYSGAPVTGFLLTPVAGPPALAFDNLQLTFNAAVPEPDSWAMALLGFGFVGAAMRKQVRTHSQKISCTTS